MYSPLAADPFRARTTNKQTGKEIYYHFSEYSKNHGGDFVAVKGDTHYVRARNDLGEPIYQAWDNTTGEPINEETYDAAPVFIGDSIFTPNKELGAEDAIVAGSTAYIGGENFIKAVDVNSSKTLWEKKVKGTVARLVAASDRLFAVTLEGKIICFGSGAASKSPQPTLHSLVLSAEAEATARQLAKQAGMDSGYALVWGIGDGTLINALAAKTKYSIIAVDSSAEKVTELRKKLNAAGLYGTKVSVHQSLNDTFDIPQHTMSIVVVNDKKSS